MQGPSAEDMVFIDPPPRVQRRGARYDWTYIVEELRKNPDEWALVLEQAPRSTAQALRRGRIAAVRPPQHFRIVTRNGQGLAADLYMKYIGPAVE
jgi:hypothetical protein